MIRSGVFGLLMIAAVSAKAAELEFVVSRPDKAPVKDAAVVAERLDGEVKAAPAKGVIDQVNKAFVSHVTVIRTGTEVSFPNKDDIRHHVYSFSPAKNFELPLYSGTPSKPVVFDKPGIVVLGCNIHDFMRGYVYVVETPYFGVTGEDGRATLKDLPDGRYRIHVWHPSLGTEPTLELREITLKGSGSEAFTLAEADAKGLRLRRAPRPGSAGYR